MVDFNKIRKKEKKSSDSTDYLKKDLSISYKNNQDLEKYNCKNYRSEDGIYDSIREYTLRDSSYTDRCTKRIDIYPYNKKKYEDIIPIELEYYLSGKIKTISTYLIFNKQHTKTYKHFYENGRLKKYISCIGTDTSDQLDKIDLMILQRDEHPWEIPFINGGGDYIEFYDNGYKRCEGSIEYIFPGGRGKPLTISEPQYSYSDLEDMDERVPDTSDYQKGRDYYRCNLWIFYDINGDIEKTIEYSKGSIILGHNISSDVFLTWIDSHYYL